LAQLVELLPSKCRALSQLQKKRQYKLQIEKIIKKKKKMKVFSEDSICQLGSVSTIGVL
jgi:hypothetical protein